MPNSASACSTISPALRISGSGALCTTERLNGRGYPLGLAGGQLPLPSRIMAVADIFTALMEDRPYRKGMSLARALDILQTMEDNGHIDGTVLATLRAEAERINRVRAGAQRRARRRFDELYRICAEPVESDVRGIFGMFQSPAAPSAD